MFVTLQDLITHADKPENQDRRFVLNSCTECLCCDLTGRSMRGFAEITPLAPEEKPGKVDPRFARFCSEYTDTRLRRAGAVAVREGALWPKGRALATALLAIWLGNKDPRDAAEETFECTLSEMTSEMPLPTDAKSSQRVAAS